MKVPPVETELIHADRHTQCGPKVLGLIFFKKIENT